MRYYITLIFALALGVSNTALAQQTLSSREMISVTPALAAEIDLPADAKASLGTKLNQIVTQNGFGATSGQFVLTANVVDLDRQVTATAPPQYMVKQLVSFYVVDLGEGVVIDETSVEVTGVDRIENRAVIQAINQINGRSSSMKAFMDGVRTTIIDYYNTRIPTLLTKAQGLADRNDFYGALEVLGSIPEAVDQFPMVAEKMTAIYTQMISREATAAIQKAKGMIAVRDYNGALDALLGVDPSAPQSAEAFAMIEQIRRTINAAEQSALDAKWRVYEDRKVAAEQAHNDAVALTSQHIEAARQVGIAQAENNGSIGSRLSRWFMGKFNR